MASNKFLNSVIHKPFFYGYFQRFGISFICIPAGGSENWSSCYITCLFDWTGGKASLDFRGLFAIVG